MEPEKDPSSYGLLVYVWVFAISIAGGLVSFSNKVTRGVASWKNMGAILAECLVSAFVGVLTFYLCEWNKVHTLLTPVFIGVSAHMGTRALYQWEKLRDRFLGVTTADAAQQQHPQDFDIDANKDPQHFLQEPRDIGKEKFKDKGGERSDA